MARETTKTGRLGGLQRFRDALRTNRELLPHLEGSFTQYDAMVTGALELANRQGVLTAEKQETSKQLTNALDEAERLATVLRLAIKQHFGIRAEKLAEFDLQPFRGRKRSAPLPAPPPVPDSTR
jgi:hypothetical protein